MPDARFFETLGPVSLRELAELTGARLADPAGAERSVSAVAPLGQAGADEVSFFADRRYVAELAASAAGAVFLAPADAETAPARAQRLITGQPLAAYAAAAARLHRPRIIAAGPAIDPSARFEEDVTLGPGAVVGSGASVGRGTVIGPGAVIGVGVQIGRHCVIGPNAVVGFALVGDRVRILAGAVIGEAGFGVAGGQAGAVDIPQLGRVILQDGVTVGANSCIDRGAYDDTVIGENTKIDNLVQIGHNTRIGRNCVMAAHTGISGSVLVGDGVRFGGRAGIADHLKIGEGAQVMAAAGLMTDIPAGETWGGFPAMPRRQWLRQTVWLTRASQAKGRGGGR